MMNDYELDYEVDFLTDEQLDELEPVSLLPKVDERGGELEEPFYVKAVPVLPR